VFRKGGNPSGHSVTQRLLYLEAAAGIIRQHWLAGVGTGDILDAYHDYYRDTNSILTEKWRLRAHNQYLTFVVTFGIIGFLWIMLSFILPVFREDKWGNYFFIMFFLIGFLSMLNEDTLETHIGISFFAFFYSLFLLGQKDDKAGN
jgi:O-antigen ligase